MKLNLLFARLLMIAILFSACKKDDVPTPPSPPTPPNPPATNTDTVGPLKSATTFPIGFAIEYNLYMNNALYRTTVNREVNSVTFGNEMKYASIVRNDGTFNFSVADNFLNTITGAGIQVYGHVLGWHSQQNATYLKNFAGITAVTGPELLTNGDFENAMTGWSVFNSNGATISATSSSGEAHTGTGAMKVINPTDYPEQWKVQVSSAAVVTTPGKQYTISYWVKAANAGGSIRLSTGPTSAQYQSDQTIGTTWQQVSWTITASIASTTFLFDMGKVANTYYIDDVSVKEVGINNSPDVAQKLDQALKNWIDAIVGRYAGKVKAWDVINELFTESGSLRDNVNTSQTSSDIFVWSNYLGRDFALKAFNYAKAADPNALLFINDYNLESNSRKLDSLIAYVNELRNKGAKVDGIGTQMHMSVNTTQSSIDQMFQKLAATGLKVRISELDIAVNPLNNSAYVFSSAEADKQAAMYKYVVSSYLKYVPSEQRHGITFWGVDDQSSWIVAYMKKNDFPLLFDKNFEKKPAYTSVLLALKGK